MPTANEIRQQFIDFFCKKHGHTFVPSSSVVPLDDPTLLFTNAGMNQFKPYFLGTEKPPYPRAANTQKCIRAGGKHNDLDDVGKDTYHHTFFEMLGNWSFGDYFKKEAITWAWELLTDVWQIDKSRLHVTVFEGDPDAGIPRDEEAANFWRAVGVPDAQIHLGNKKDNFWEMGETGPCGPCTEVHYDNTPDKTGGKLVNKGTADVIEIWNLVFIQFNRNSDKSLTPLPAKHVDTGMGFERITKVLQGKDSNYDTDVFTPIMDAISQIVGTKYGGKLDDPDDIAFRVIADHVRMLTFAITDGGLPSNKGRGSVVRSVLRRAVRFGYQRFRQRAPFVFKLVRALVEKMGQAFPELKTKPGKVQDVIKAEEADFLQTIERGLRDFRKAAAYAVREAIRHSNGETVLVFTEEFDDVPDTQGFDPSSQAQIVHCVNTEGGDGRERQYRWTDSESGYRQFVAANFTKPPVLAGESIFYLYTTNGFPPDLTRQMAHERGLMTDDAGFERLMAEHEEKSRSGAGTLGMGPMAISGKGTVSHSTDAFIVRQTDDSLKFDGLIATAKITGWFKDNQIGESGEFSTGNQLALMLDCTNFYAEQGGQVGDKGTIKSSTGVFFVEDTKRLGAAVLHIGKVSEGTVKTGQKAALEVDPARLDIMRNHTATHLLNWALREVLGDHVEQKGSLVDAEKTRFDFTHDKPMTADELAEVERLVNEKILADQPVTAINQPLDKAKTIAGVRAVFGEKYPDPVRVVIIGADKPEEATAQMSVEFCGGTHLSRTSQACLFKIVSQEGVAKGVRRITAVTGPKAIAHTQQLAMIVGELSERFHCRAEELPTRVESLQEEVKALQQQLRKGAASDLAGTFDKLLASAMKVGDVTVIVGEIAGGPDDAIRTQVDRVKQKAGSSVVVVGWVDGEKVGLLAAVTDDVIKRGIKAGDLIKQIAPIVGGGGGGRPNMAQAGGKDPAKLGDALAQARKMLGEQLAK